MKKSHLTTKLTLGGKGKEEGKGLWGKGWEVPDLQRVLRNKSWISATNLHEGLLWTLSRKVIRNKYLNHNPKISRRRMEEESWEGQVFQGGINSSVDTCIGFALKPSMGTSQTGQWAQDWLQLMPGFPAVLKIRFTTTLLYIPCTLKNFTWANRTKYLLTGGYILSYMAFNKSFLILLAYLLDLPAILWPNDSKKQKYFSRLSLFI